jgi:hypothetical protein
VVGQDQGRPATVRRAPVDHDPHPEQPEEQAVEKDGKPSRQTPAETEGQHLGRDEKNSSEAEDEKPGADSDGRHRFLAPLPSRGTA